MVDFTDFCRAFVALDVNFSSAEKLAVTGALVRHADVARAITRHLELKSTTEWLTQLDRLMSNHYPVMTRDALPPQAVLSVLTQLMF